MRCLPILLALYFLISCGDRQDAKFKEAVKVQVTNIMTNEIASVAKITKPVQVDNIEIEKVSRVDYYNYEMEEQDKQYKKFLEFASKHNYPVTFENQQRHDSVMSYLKRSITHASPAPAIYKVIYQLTGATQSAQLNQRQTIFLDSTLKKVVTDYTLIPMR